MRSYTQEDLERLPEKVYDPVTGRGIEKAALQEEEGKAAAATAKINSQVSDSLFKATHSDLENSLREIDQRAEKLKAAGASEKEIVRLAEAEKAKIYRDFNDNTLSQVQKSWKSALQNRLDDIEREKRAWIQKGVSEVTATKWAEHEKGKVRQQAGLEALKQQKSTWIFTVKRCMDREQRSRKPRMPKWGSLMRCGNSMVYRMSGSPRKN